jgi:hypothetical protein
MTITDAEIARLRRMIAEAETSTVYTDEVLAEYVEACALPDKYGRDPDNDDWIPTYDFNAAAAEIWTEKANLLTGNTDFNADGASYSDSQQYDHAMAQSRFYASRRSARSVRLIKWPLESRARVEDDELSV